MIFNEDNSKFFIGAILVVFVAVLVAIHFILPEGFYAATNIFSGIGF